MMKFAVLLALCSSQTLLQAADTQAAIQIWEGKGVRFDADKANPTPYSLRVEIRPIAQGKSESKALITLADKQIITITCLHSDSKKGTSLSCSNGVGGSYCFDNRMCQSYVSDEQGRAFATSIAIDGKDQMRLVRTELKHGRAVGFFQETLSQQ